MKTETLDKVLTGLQEDHFLLRESKKNPDWLKNIKGNVGHLLSDDAKPEDIVSILLKGQTADALVSLYKQARLKVEDLEVQLGKRKKAAPRIGGGGDGKPKPIGDELPGSVEELASQTVFK